MEQIENKTAAEALADIRETMWFTQCLLPQQITLLCRGGAKFVACC